MTPPELLAACLERIADWNAGATFADQPTMALTLMRAKPPYGQSIRLYGRSGPAGRIANVQKKGDSYQVVAYFPAAQIARDVADFLGVVVDLTVLPKRAKGAEIMVGHDRA